MGRKSKRTKSQMIGNGATQQTPDFSNRTIKRLPQYLRLLRQMQDKGESFASAAVIAHELMIDPIVVRKDLAGTGVSGKPRIGFPVNALILAIQRLLGWNLEMNAILVGAGRLGSALLGYPGFLKHGFKIVAAFDNREDLPESISGVPIYPLEQMSEVVTKLNVSIGIITVPAGAAQSAADGLIAAGVKGIWNFTPICLHTPERVKVRHEDLASSLAVLSHSIVTGNL